MSYFGDMLIMVTTITIIGAIIFYALTWRGKEQYQNLARNFFNVSTALITATIGLLLYLILTHDFSIAYVYSYSSTDLPLGYLISSLWGGQEGTFLLWIFFVAIMGLVLKRTAGEFENGSMLFISLFILSILVILIKKSPFELLPVVRTEGAGLNPLLQNFWMQIHPPLMFVGFAGAVFPFAFGMTALISRRYNTWAESARKWTLFAWIALGVSLVMGGYWAYVTLGWGGFWAWDPVENSSFIPWIFLATQVHVLFIKRVRRGLMRFSLFMVCLTFWSVLYGTFLTRSGVLADFSVHSFVDLGLNNYLIGGLFFFMIVGLSLLIWRWKDIQPKPSFSKVASRSYLVSLGIVTLAVGGLLTLIGTSAPLLTRVTDNPSSVGLDYYFLTMTPIAILLQFLIAFFPAFRWNNGISKPIIIKLAVATIASSIILMLVTGFTYSLMYLLFFSSAAAAIVSNSYVIIKSYKSNFQPGYLAHIGLAIAMLGAGWSAGFETKYNVTLPQNKPVQAAGYTITFANTVEHQKGFDCHVIFDDGNSQFTAVLPHEFPKNMEGVMKRPHVKKYFDHDLYVAPLAFEPASNDDGTHFTFEKGQTKKVDKYSITFHDFELTSHDMTEATTAGANLTIEYDGKAEQVMPSISVMGDSLENLPASFDYGKGQVILAGIDPDNGALMLQILGDFIQPMNPKAANLIIEIDEKPMINLFWFGTILCFFSGALSMRERRRKQKMVLESEPEEAVKEKISV